MGKCEYNMNIYEYDLSDSVFAYIIFECSDKMNILNKSYEWTKRFDWIDILAMRLSMIPTTGRIDIDNTMIQHTDICALEQEVMQLGYQK